MFIGLMVNWFPLNLEGTFGYLDFERVDSKITRLTISSLFFSPGLGLQMKGFNAVHY